VKPITKKLRLAYKNPSLAWHKARVTFRNEVTAKWDYFLRDGKARPPLVVAARLTNLCNMNCKMCGQPNVGDENVPKSFFADHLSLDEWKQVVDRIAGFRPNFYLWGGEPLIYKGIFDLVAYAKERGLTVQINTNALLLEKLAQEVIDSGLDDLIISLDGPEAVHDEIRGLPGAFAKLRDGIAEVRRLQAEHDLHKPIIRIRGTIHPDNFSHLQELVGITWNFGGDSLNFNQLWFTSLERGRQYQSVMKKLFGTKATSWQGFVYEPNDLPLDDLGSAMEQLAANAVDFPITVSPYIPPAEVGNYYYDLDYTCGAKTCYAIYCKTYLMPNGDVTPCPDYPDFIAGNLRKQSLLEIWNGAMYRDFRRQLKQHRLLPICARCCDLYVSNVKFM
jgi:radical SAM protein with 4Fe4S-binding SPASM domain